MSLENDVYVYYVGDSVEVICETEGGPNNTFHWYHNDTEILNNENDYVIETDSSLSELTISNIKLKNTGAYVCNVSNAAGHDSGSVELVVKPPEQTSTSMSLTTKPSSTSGPSASVLSTTDIEMPLPTITTTMPPTTVTVSMSVPTTSIVTNSTSVIVQSTNIYDGKVSAATAAAIIVPVVIAPAAIVAIVGGAIVVALLKKNGNKLVKDIASILYVKWPLFIRLQKTSNPRQKQRRRRKLRYTNIYPLA